MSEMISGQREPVAASPVEMSPVAGSPQVAPPFQLSSGEDEEGGIQLKAAGKGEMPFQLKSNHKKEGENASIAEGRSALEMLNYERMAVGAKQALSEGNFAALLSAMAPLQGDAARIKEFKRTYTVSNGSKLTEDLAQRLSPVELEQALAFLQVVGTEGSDVDVFTGELVEAIGKASLDEALPVLRQMNANGALRAQVGEAYIKRTGKDLMRDVEAAFGGQALQLALEMLGFRSNTETLKSQDPADQKKGQAIIRRIYKQYGIDVNTQAGLDALKAQYDEVPNFIIKDVKPDSWTMRELVAVEKALKSYGPILGPKRGDSSRGDVSQELKTAGKVNYTLTRNRPTGKLDTATLGQAFADDKAMMLFRPGEDTIFDFDTVDKQIAGNSIHEICHLVMEYAEGDFINKMDYWKSLTKPSEIEGAEAPITSYGTFNAKEDLAEAVMFFFVEPETLKNGRGKDIGLAGNPCPERYAFIEAKISEWDK